MPFKFFSRNKPVEDNPDTTSDHELKNLISKATSALYLKDFEQALAESNHALELEAGNLQAKTSKCEALTGLGQFDAALDTAGQIIKADPDSVTARVCLAKALYHKGDEQAALAQCRKALEIDSSCHKCHSLTGIILLNQSDPVAAKDSFQNAISIKPNNPDYLFNLGNALRVLGDREGALGCFDTVISIDESDYEAHNNRGNILKILNKPHDALSAYETAMEIKPDYVPAIINASMLYEVLNKLDKAGELLDKALEIDPTDKVSLLQAATLNRRMKRWDDALHNLEQITIDQLPEEHLRVGYLYERGRVHDGLHDEDKAIYYFNQANQAAISMTSTSNRDKSVYRDVVEELIKIHTPEWVAQWAPISGDTLESNPTFLIGFARSGTTLLDQILSSHPDIRVVPELAPISLIRSQFGIDLTNYKTRVQHMTIREVSNIRSAYFDMVEAQIGNTEGKMIIDKLPMNTVELGFINRIFPDAKLIFALRHPYDVVLSSFMQHFELNDAMLQFTNLEDSAIFYDRVMTLYKQYKNTLDLKLTTVRYENIVSDLETEIRHLLDFLGLEWDDSLLDYRQTALSRGYISTPSYSAVSEDIYQHARYRWKRYRDHMQYIIPVLEPWSRYFGYEDKL